MFALAVGAALWFALPAAGILQKGYLLAGISGGAAGYIATGTLKGALIGAGTAMAFYGVGQMNLGRTEGALAHGVVGGTSSVASGGKFQTGFISAGFSKFIGPEIKGILGESDVARFTAHATVGGIAAELGGGKFENGFVTAAFGYLFNEMGSRMEEAVALRKFDADMRAIGMVQVPMDGRRVWMTREAAIDYHLYGDRAGSFTYGTSFQGSSTYIFGLGISKSFGTAVDMEGNICPQSSTCLLAGPGAYAGYGVSGGIQAGAPLTTGEETRFGAFTYGGTGLSAGGSFDIGGSGVGGVKGFVGAGSGAATGIQVCRVKTAC